MSCELESILSLDRWLTIARNSSTFKGEREKARNLNTVSIEYRWPNIQFLGWLGALWVEFMSSLFHRCSAHNLFTQGELLVVANETIAI